MEPQVTPRSSISPGLAAIYAARTDWGIDPVSGNDKNTGRNVPGQRLQTHAELTRRLRGLVLNPGTPSPVRIHILSSLPDGDPMTFNNIIGGLNFFGFQYIGTKTTSYSGSATGVTVENFLLSQPFELADAAIPGGWTGRESQRVRLTSGGFVDFVAWAAADLGGSNARVNAWEKPQQDPSGIYFQDVDLTAAGPSIGDTYVIETLPSATLGLFDIQFTASDAAHQIAFVDMQIKPFLGPSENPGGGIQPPNVKTLFIQCLMGRTDSQVSFNWQTCSDEVNFVNCCNIQNQFFRYTTVFVAGGLNLNDHSNNFDGSWDFNHHCSATFDGGTCLFQGRVGAGGVDRAILANASTRLAMGASMWFNWRATMIAVRFRSACYFTSAHFYDPLGVGASGIAGTANNGGRVLNLNTGSYASGSFAFGSWVIAGTSIIDVQFQMNDQASATVSPTSKEARALNWGTDFGSTGAATYSAVSVAATAANMFTGIGAGGFLNYTAALSGFVIDEGSMTHLQYGCQFAIRNYHV